MKPTILIVCACICALCTTRAIAGEQIGLAEALSRPVEQTDLHAPSLPDLARWLMSKARAPLAVERPGKYCCGEGVDLSEKPISLHLPAGASFQAALDAAVAQDPRYEWKTIGCWVHVLPRERDSSYILDQEFKGELPQTAPLMTMLDAATAQFPATWTRHFSVRLSTQLETRAYELPPGAKLSVRQAIDVALWRGGAAGWEMCPVNDKDGHETGATLVTLLRSVKLAIGPAGRQ